MSRPERSTPEWTTTSDGLHRCFDPKGRLMGAMFWTSRGWRACLGKVGDTWTLFESKKKAEAFVECGGEA
ncbi:MAG: hypothetical protein JST05_01210 [Acidobacteria bacterium]|nr:hypothetical protein [Acidobacteriota bacterium]